MSYLLFMDESGHDHNNMPLEVRGGVAIELSKLWSFQQAWKNLEYECFGTELSKFGKELKGSNLLNRKKFKFASRPEEVGKALIAKEARTFLETSQLMQPLNPLGMKAYGLAGLHFVDGVFDLLSAHDARIFATSIPKGMHDKKNLLKETHLRKDYAFLIERFYYFLEANDKDGMLVLDETDRTDDRRFINRIGRYFRSTNPGKQRSRRVFPIPFFVASDMSVGVQAADIVLYCLNWGFRKTKGLEDTHCRVEIQKRYENKIGNLQWMGQISGSISARQTRSIVHIPDPFTYRN
jgi:hypothetical protein